SAGTPRVVTRALRSSAKSAAAVVKVLLVEAGCRSRSSNWLHSSSPVIASVTRAPSLPRLGSATTAARAAARPDFVGVAALSATGTDPRFGGDGWRRWRSLRSADAAAAAGEQRGCRHQGGNDRQHAHSHDQVRRRTPRGGTHDSPDFYPPIVPKPRRRGVVREPYDRRQATILRRRSRAGAIR